MERMCPSLGTQRVKIVSDYNWYTERVSKPQTLPVSKSRKNFKKGCPYDCGMCECHTGSIHLPVFSITNDCNLNCSICFTYNRPDKKYYKSIKDTRKIVQHILDQAGKVELINLTGGEPTLHPDLFEILETCHNSKIGRITMNTNGIKIATDSRFAENIKQAGVQLVLSLHTFDPHKSVLIHGADITRQKRQALEILESLNIPTTILCVCIKDVNEEDIAGIVEHYFRKDFVRSITIQNMTFTGAMGTTFQPHDHITIDEVEKLIATREGFSQKDFFSLSSYHPLCYSVAYYIVYKERVLPLTKIIDNTILATLSEGSYLLDANPDMSTYFRNGIDRLWAEGEDEHFISTLKQFITELYPSNKKLTSQKRREIAEKMIKMIYVHPHMDADNFDIARVSRCGDIVPDESGQMIPACSYNLIYRKEDPRFWTER